MNLKIKKIDMEAPQKVSDKLGKAICSKPKKLQYNLKTKLVK